MLKPKYSPLKAIFRVNAEHKREYLEATDPITWSDNRRRAKLFHLGLEEDRQAARAALKALDAEADLED